jgi:5-methylcytosine-specific restriction endonuclease McrA
MGLGDIPYKKVKDKAGTSRRHYQRICSGCGKEDWVLSTQLKSKCPDCKVNPRTFEDYSRVAKKLWSSDEYRKTHKKSMEGVLPRGKDHHFWRGGKSKPRTFTPEYVEWRTAVYQRDDYTCQHCGEVGGKLNAHHIESWSSFPEKRFEIDNGITLCYKCHVEVHKVEGGFQYANKFIKGKGS